MHWMEKISGFGPDYMLKKWFPSTWLSLLLFLLPNQTGSYRNHTTFKILGEGKYWYERKWMEEFNGK